MSTRPSPSPEAILLQEQALERKGGRLANVRALGTPLKAANWAVGGFVTGATIGFERCQYLRRLERISMKRIVEVHQADVEEKKRIKEAEDAEEARRKALEKKAWYKFW